jgi:uncharacterized protein
MKYALITGASKGIGKEMAICLAKKDYNLLLVARSEKLLEETANYLSEKYQKTVHYLPLDLSENGAVDKIITWIQQHQFPVNVLINNAGYGLWGNFDELEWNDQRNMLSLNVNTLVELTYKMIPVLESQPAPRYILNVGSMAGVQPVPGLNLYAATKSLVNHFTRGLSWELRRKNISVTLLSPGGVRTDFVNRAGMQAIAQKADKMSMNANEVAAKAIRGMLKGSREVVPGFTNRFGIFMERLFPKSFVERMAGSIYQNK